MKGNNIFVDKDHNGLKIKIGDFGLSKTSLDKYVIDTSTFYPPFAAPESKNIKFEIEI